MTQSIASGVVLVLVAAALAALAVHLWRRRVSQATLEANSDLVANTYPVIGLVYGVFLGFTIVITWTRFLDAENVVMEEVTRLSELWRDAEVFPEQHRERIHDALLAYAREVVASDWDSMARTGRHSDASTARYEEIWAAYYALAPSGPTQEAFYAQSVSELNELGRDRRQRGLFGRADVHPVVRVLLVGGGILTVLFSLLLPAASATVQMVVTGLMASVISFSVLVALALQHPFSGDVSVRPEAFEEIVRSFERR